MNDPASCCYMAPSKFIRALHGISRFADTSVNNEFVNVLLTSFLFCGCDDFKPFR